MSIISLFRAAFSQPKNVFDDFRPAVAHPETAADWKENCNCWLAYWLTPVFKSVLKLEQDEPHSSASLRRSNFRQTGARMQLDEILATITTTLRDLSIVLELYGSASILSPHISVVWPFVRAKLRLRYRTSNDYTSLDLMEDLVRRWQTEAGAAMTEVLSTQEEGRALLRTFRWQPESI